MEKINLIVNRTIIILLILGLSASCFITNVGIQEDDSIFRKVFTGEVVSISSNGNHTKTIYVKNNRGKNNFVVNTHIRPYKIGETVSFTLENPKHNFTVLTFIVALIISGLYLLCRIHPYSEIYLSYKSSPKTAIFLSLLVFSILSIRPNVEAFKVVSRIDDAIIVEPTNTNLLYLHYEDVIYTDSNFHKSVKSGSEINLPIIYFNYYILLLTIPLILHKLTIKEQLRWK